MSSISVIFSPVAGGPLTILDISTKLYVVVIAKTFKPSTVRGPPRTGLRITTTFSDGMEFVPDSTSFFYV